jgi:hypothetical protein
MRDSFFSATCSKHFCSDKYVAIYVLDVQETSRRCRRNFRIHTYREDANILIFTRFVRERARDGKKVCIISTAMSLNLEYFFGVLCNSLYLPLCRTDRLVSWSRLKCYFELRWQYCERRLECLQIVNKISYTDCEYISGWWGEDSSPSDCHCFQQWNKILETTNLRIMT